MSINKANKSNSYHSMDKFTDKFTDKFICPSDCPSICIPRVFIDIPTCRIIEIFQKKLQLGLIKKVDSILCNDNKFKKIFIHFDFWRDDEITSRIKNKFLNGDIMKIVYDDPYFWKCSLSKTELS